MQIIMIDLSDSMIISIGKRLLHISHPGNGNLNDKRKPGSCSPTREGSGENASEAGFLVYFAFLKFSL